MAALALLMGYRLVARNNPLAVSVSAASAVLLYEAFGLISLRTHRVAAVFMVLAWLVLVAWAILSRSVARRDGRGDR